ncbi:MAG: PDZ domain-containing protein [Myxococcota bacterium]
MRSPTTRAALAAWLLLACTPEELGCEPKVAEAPDAGEEEAPSVRVEPTRAAPRGDGEANEYTLRMDDRAQHYVEVEAVLPAGGERLELMMAVWTPGSYLVREYARHVEAFEAMTLEGEPLPLRKTRKNRWVVDAPPPAEEDDEAPAEDEAAEAAPPGPPVLPARIAIRYRVYANELTVRTSFVGEGLASLNGAAVYVAPVEALAAPYDVRIYVPESWETVATALPTHPEATEGEARYLAASFDELLDSPWVAGEDGVLTPFDAGGVPHVLASFEGGDVFDQTRAAEDVRRIVEAQQRFWRVVPYERYVFLNVLNGGGGGLEHLASTLMLANRWVSTDDADYRRWLGLVSHEFFHTWNVKRLRPTPLGPFDYENENYVRDLWVAEGVTSYYDDLLLRRAGLISRDEYLKVLSDNIDRVIGAPGHRVQSLSMASFDAWIKYYRPDENSVNTAVSYYLKGMLVAFLLDARIREATDNERSLDDVMRLAYERFASRAEGFSPEEFRALASEVAESDQETFLAELVDGAGEMAFEPALRTYGLRFAPVEGPSESAFLGARVDEDGKVRSVRRGTPAYAAGLSAGDELLAIDDERLPKDVPARLKRMTAGTEVTLLVARRGRLRRLPCTLGEVPANQSRSVEVDPEAGPAQRRALDDWLGPAE